MDDLTRQIQKKGETDYRLTQKQKLSPPPLLKIGEYHQESGRYKVIYPNGGQVIAGVKLFNSSVPDGTPVRATQAYGAQAISLDYKNHIPLQIEEKEEEEVIKGFIVWNTGYTRGGHVDVVVDWFSEITDRTRKDWKQCTSNEENMPKIQGLKLIYIPMVSKSLSTDEVSRLKAFQKAGGITFVTGEHSTFSRERQKANEIMELLNSPLRCIDNNNSYYHPSLNNENFNYPTTFENGSTLFSNASCQVTGGKTISFFPAGIVTNGSQLTTTDITWIAYDENSRTILSGDVDWASSYTTLNPGNDNIAFAQSILKLKW